MPSQNVGLWTGIIVCCLVCTDALKAQSLSAGSSPAIKALYVTSSFPKDTMPIDIMVQHQLNTLNSDRVELRAVVFDNQPPWLPGAEEGALNLQTKGLEALRKSQYRRKNHKKPLPVVAVKNIDYDGIDDPEFLAPFFAVNASRKQTLRELYGTAGEHAQMMSNFFAMTNFMQECIKPENEDIDICMYFDPDILMYQNHSAGIIDLAAATFEDNPEFMVVSPPYGCFQTSWWGRENSANGACASRISIVSSRHVLLHRKRLKARLPIAVRPMDIGHQYWEVTMTESIDRDTRGQILCGQEFFVVHPPSRYQKNKKGTFSLRDLLAELVPRLPATGNNESQVQMSALLGTQELVRRFEAGRFTADRQSLYNQGCGCCADMIPSMSRVHSGEAFYKYGRDVTQSSKDASMNMNAVNDAAFDWVVKCSQ